jgi:hypothetical protein
MRTEAYLMKNRDLQIRSTDEFPTCEVLILADGNILTHSTTTELANVLSKLNPDDKPMRERARRPSEASHL